MNRLIINLKATLLEVQSDLVSLRLQKALKRSVFVAALKKPSVSLEKNCLSIKSNVYKSYPEVLEIKQNVKTLMQSCSSLSEAVAQAKIKPRDMMTQLDQINTDLSIELKRIDAVLSYLQPDDKQNVGTAMELNGPENTISRKDQREDAATAKTSQVISKMKARYQDKVPKELNNVLQIHELPVMARYKTLAMNPDALTRMGFKVESAGLHSTASSDLGIIFERQLVLFYRISDARQVAEEEIQRAKDTDGVLMRRKALQKKRNEHRRELKQLNLLAEKAHGKKRAVLDRQIDEEQEAIDKITTALESQTDQFKQSASIGRVRRQMRTSNDHAVLEYLTTLIDTINTNPRCTTDYGLYTTMPLNGVMRDSDVAAAWLMPKTAIRLLMNHTGGDNKLQTWFLPWSNG